MSRRTCSGLGWTKRYGTLSWGTDCRGWMIYYLKPSDEDLRVAMERYTEWLDVEIAQASASVAQNVAQEEKRPSDLTH